MPKELLRGTLGIAAEYAVASELCRRGIYAQLTLGHQKKTDLLVFFESGQLARIEVKAKQGREWPNCKGISRSDTYLVFVDYEGRDASQRPDFFVLDARDWLRVLKKRVAEIQERNPNKKIRIVGNVSIFEEEIGRNGKPYQGMGIRAADVERYRDLWEKIG